MPTKSNNSKLTSKRKTEVYNKLEQLSTKDPIPFEGGRGFSSIADRAYLPFLAPDDNYARLLLQFRLLSVTHNACIVTKSTYCAGNGFQLPDEQEITNKKFKDWIKNVNLKGHSAIEISEHTLQSYFTYGNTPIELVRFRFNRKPYFYVYVHNLLEWRLGMPAEDTDISWFAIQSKLFRQGDTYTYISPEQLKTAKILPIYNPSYKDEAKPQATRGFNWITDGKVERTLIWWNNPSTGFDNYGLPSAVSSLVYQQLEYKKGRFDLDDIENGAVVSAILALKGAVTQTEINNIGRKVVAMHTGDGKRGRVMVVGSEQGIDGSDLHPMTVRKEGSYNEADGIWTQKIILANEWDSLLAGIISTMTFGKGAGYLTKVIEHKQNTVIRPMQQRLMSKVWNNILRLADEWMGFGNLDIENLQIKNAIDISGLTDVDITPAVKVDEVRNAKGLPKLEDKKKGQQLLGEMKGNQMKGVYVKPGSKTKTDPTTGGTQ